MYMGVKKAKAKSKVFKASFSLAAAFMSVGYQAYAGKFGDGSVDSTVEINSSTLDGPVLADNDRFGTSVASIGDLNGDGVDDLAVGAYSDDTGGSGRGAVHILFMGTATFLEYGKLHSYR